MMTSFPIINIKYGLLFPTRPSIHFISITHLFAFSYRKYPQFLTNVSRETCHSTSVFFCSTFFFFWQNAAQMPGQADAAALVKDCSGSQAAVKSNITVRLARFFVV